MNRFADWVESFEGKRSFAARPLVFDGLWIDQYLKDYTNSFLADIPYLGRNIFTAGALDIGTYMSGIFNRADPHMGAVKFPPEWHGNNTHSHRAIDDARGYATLVSKLLKIANDQPPHPDDFSIE